MAQGGRRYVRYLWVGVACAGLVVLNMLSNLSAAQADLHVSCLVFFCCVAVPNLLLCPQCAPSARPSCCHSATRRQTASVHSRARRQLLLSQHKQPQEQQQLPLQLQQPRHQ